MSVRAAVEKRDAAAVEAAEQPPLHVLAQQAIERQAVTLGKILPQHMGRDRFEQITLAAIKATPKLLWCFETREGQVSLLYSVIQAAAAGLSLDPIAAEAYLIPYQKSYKDDQGRWHKRWEARMQVSDRGVRDLARRDPRVRELVADVVREGDHFLYRRGLEGDVFEHEVRGPSNRPLTHAYCLIRWREGGAQPIVMDREDVLAIRDRYSEGWKGELTKAEADRSNPWSTREPAMWVKTVIHQARRWLDLTPDVAAALTADADVTPVAPSPPAEFLEAAGLPALPPADENGEPYYADDGLPANPEFDIDDPEPPASTAPDAVTVDQLLAALAMAGHFPDGMGLGTARKRLVALAAELVGVTVEHADELVADQAVAEELLAKLTPVAES